MNVLMTWRIKAIAWGVVAGIGLLVGLHENKKTQGRAK